MISSITGRLEALGADWAVINVSGIGFQVRMAASTLASLGAVGGEVRVHTHLQLREDGMTLYGFASPEELALFEILTTVSGIGPRTAMSLLSALKVEQLTSAIATGNADLLTAAPGIGKKTASRIVLELKDKIGAGWAISAAGQVAAENADVIAALTALGYSAAEATRAVSNLPTGTKLSLEEKVKVALQSFARR